LQLQAGASKEKKTRVGDAINVVLAYSAKEGLDDRKEGKIHEEITLSQYAGLRQDAQGLNRLRIV